MSLLCVPWKWTSIKKKAETPLDDDQLIKTYLENGEWWNPLDFQGVWVLKERGKTCQERKSGRHSLPIFLPWKKSTARCNNFKDPGVQVGLGGEDVVVVDHGAWLGSIWILVLVWGNEKDGKTFFAQFFCFRKKTHLNLSIFFSGRLFLGVFGWHWEGFYPWNALSRCIFLVQNFYRHLLQAKPASLLNLEILVGGRFHSQIGQRNVHSGKIH